MFQQQQAGGFRSVAVDKQLECDVRLGSTVQLSSQAGESAFGAAQVSTSGFKSGPPQSTFAQPASIYGFGSEPPQEQSEFAQSGSGFSFGGLSCLKKLASEHQRALNKAIPPIQYSTRSAFRGPMIGAADLDALAMLPPPPPSPPQVGNIPLPLPPAYPAYFSVPCFLSDILKVIERRCRQDASLKKLFVTYGKFSLFF